MKSRYNDLTQLLPWHIVISRFHGIDSFVHGEINTQTTCCSDNILFGNRNNNRLYHMANPVLGKSLCSDWFFLGQDLQYGPFPWKRSNPCIFVLERSRQIQNLQPKQRKKVWISLFFTLKLPEEAEKIEFFPKFQSWMKKTTSHQPPATSSAFYNEKQSAI